MNIIHNMSKLRDTELSDWDYQDDCFYGNTLHQLISPISFYYDISNRALCLWKGTFEMSLSNKFDNYIFCKLE